MEPTAAGTLLESLGMPLGLVAILTALLWYLINHITRNTVSASVYAQTCDNQRNLERAIAEMGEAVRELAVAHVATNELIRVLVGRD